MENAVHKEAAKMPKVNEDGQNMWYKHAQSNVSIKRRNGNGEQDMTRGHVQWLQCTIPFSPQTESLHKTTLQRCNTVVYTWHLKASVVSQHSVSLRIMEYCIIPGGTVTRHSQVKVLSGFQKSSECLRWAHEHVKRCERSVSSPGRHFLRTFRPRQIVAAVARQTHWSIPRRPCNRLSSTAKYLHRCTMIGMPFKLPTM